VTRSSAIADGPRDALYQSKSCQMLHSCTKNHILQACSRNDLVGDSKSSELPLFDNHISFPIWLRVSKLKIGHVTLTTPLLGVICHT